MAIQRMDHVGIVVDDLAAATEFFVELGNARPDTGFRRLGEVFHLEDQLEDRGPGEKADERDVR